MDKCNKRENEKPTLRTRRQILACGVAMAGAIPSNIWLSAPLTRPAIQRSTSYG
jgi:hypothetical protein